MTRVGLLVVYALYQPFTEQSLANSGTGVNE